MKLSTKGRYGLRALIDLAQHGGEGPVSITSIAERQEISERYLEQLMSKLKKAGIIQSIRGAQGGVCPCKGTGRSFGGGGTPCAGRRSQSGRMFRVSLRGRLPGSR